MGLFTSPRTLYDAYGSALTLLRFAGIFPFTFDLKQQKFLVSWKFIGVTVIHICVYTYVNVTSIMENWRDYSQPMIGHSSLSALGNLALRLLSIVTTFSIILRPMLSSREYADVINMYMELVDEMVHLGIDVTCIYRRVYYLSTFLTFGMVGCIGVTAWHSVYFYEVITLKSPEFKYYLVVTLPFVYKILHLYYGSLRLFGIYMISKQLNRYLTDLKTSYKDVYDQERMLKYGGMKPMIREA